MSDEIKVGDLVYVAKITDCGCPLKLGLVTKVTRLWVAATGTECVCGNETFFPTPYADDANGGVCSVSRLKRIPPLEELDALDYEHKLDVRA